MSIKKIIILTIEVFILIQNVFQGVHNILQLLLHFFSNSIRIIISQSQCFKLLLLLLSCIVYKFFNTTADTLLHHLYYIFKVSITVILYK